LEEDAPTDQTLVFSGFHLPTWYGGHIINSLPMGNALRPASHVTLIFDFGDRNEYYTESHHGAMWTQYVMFRAHPVSEVPGIPVEFLLSFQ
jgi:hypothetical protein